MTGTNEYVQREAGCPTGFDIADLVSDKHGAREIQTVFAGGTQEHPGGGLPAFTVNREPLDTTARVMRTVVHTSKRDPLGREGVGHMTRHLFEIER